MQAIPLCCSVEGCNRPWAHIYNGLVSVDSRHQGRYHVNAITLQILIELMIGTLGAYDEEALCSLAPAFYAPVQIETEESVSRWAIPLRCYRRDCQLPWAYVYGGVLDVTVYHDGEHHRNQISMQRLNHLLNGEVYARLWRDWSIKPVAPMEG